MTNNYCDLETGVCQPSSLSELKNIGSDSNMDRTEIIYVGDPMCSWCWGISPALKELRDHYKGKLAYRIVVGGLRPGGGDEWDDQMKSFLKHHWSQVSERSGQPFGYKLFDLDDFDYDTEPACRAVVAARPFLGHNEMDFFEAIQRKFYVESQDPSSVHFYASICDQFNINFGEFEERFNSEDVMHETVDEFNLNRSWGVTGYPTVVLHHENKLNLVSNGFTTFEQMKAKVEALIQTAKKITAD